MNVSYPDLRIARGRITVITIMREAKRNALTSGIIAQIGEATRELEADLDVRAVILTGAGKQAFAAGADISELAAAESVEQATAISAVGQSVFASLERAAVPIIAALNGATFGGGLELALACDLRVAIGSAILGFPEVGLGLLPGFGGTQRLRELIGPSRALQMILTAKKLSAREAKDLGLVDLLAEDVAEDGDDAVGAARALATVITAFPRGAIAAAKAAIRAGVSEGRTAGFARESALFAEAVVSQEGRDGVAAFLRRRRSS
jgi:enoyl-CoA hydratase